MLRDEIIGRHFSTFYTETDKAAGMPSRALETAARRAASRRKAGGFARTGPASGRTSSSTPSAMKRAN